MDGLTVIRHSNDEPVRDGVPGRRRLPGPGRPPPVRSRARRGSTRGARGVPRPDRTKDRCQSRARPTGSSSAHPALVERGASERGDVGDDSVDAEAARAADPLGIVDGPHVDGEPERVARARPAPRRRTDPTGAAPPRPAAAARAAASPPSRWSRPRPNVSNTRYAVGRPGSGIASHERVSKSKLDMTMSSVTPAVRRRAIRSTTRVDDVEAPRDVVAPEVPRNVLDLDVDERAETRVECLGQHRERRSAARYRASTRPFADPDTTDRGERSVRRQRPGGRRARRRRPLGTPPLERPRGCSPGSPGRRHGGR